jgi:F-type H+-transporting ATPase subunit epsilon
MSTFQVSLVSPEALVFSGEADQVDLPGTEGDFGVLAGHAAIVAMLRPGIVTLAARGGINLRFVVLGGLVEFSQAELTILADSAESVDDFDLVGLAAQIDEMEKSLTEMTPDDGLDRAIVLLDRYKSIHLHLSSYATTAF